MRLYAFFGPLRALRKRLHAFLVVMRCLDDMSCFLAVEFFVLMVLCKCDVRTVERWMLKDSGD